MHTALWSSLTQYWLTLYLHIAHLHAGIELTLSIIFHVPYYVSPTPGLLLPVFTLLILQRI